MVHCIVHLARWAHVTSFRTTQNYRPALCYGPSTMDYGPLTNNYQLFPISLPGENAFVNETFIQYL